LYLKRIELNGFKSFPNKKEIIINSGITGIVGPNGCGKSNIADALRWVLGEQSVKSLRGDSMQDVIFNGTQSRTQKGFCEVVLVFDNSDGRMDSDYSEIAVKRKMYRSGESEFSINNNACRLKDVLELIRDTGIGKEGYSIIGQGRIDEILTNKPVKRRRVFEEAAGIMKYRVRKEEAERNLQKTEENVVRLSDIISELETQIEPLEAQMKETTDYLALRDRLKELEINLFLYNYDRGKERIEKLSQQMLESEQQKGETDTEAETLDKRAAELKKELGEAQQKIDEHNSRLADFSSLLEKTRGELNLIEEKEKSDKARLEEGSLKKEGLLEKQREGLQRIDELNGEVEQSNEEIDAQYEKIDALRAEIEELGEKTGSMGEHTLALREELSAKRVELQTLAVQLSEAQAKLEMTEQKTAEQAEKEQAAKEAAQSLQVEIDELNKALFVQEKSDEENRKKLNEVLHLLNELREKVDGQKQEMAAHSEKRGRRSSRLRLLKEMREGHEGYFDSVRALLKSADENRHIQGKIKGVLAELIQVPKEYETAIEVILGNALQNVVTETDEAAKEIIAFLRERDLGRVTFLPAQSLKIRYLDEKEKKLLAMEGVISVAADVIDCGKDVRPAVDFLLGRTVLVSDMDVAMRLMKKCDYGIRVVTLDGDFIKPGGAITGGSLKKTNTGLLSRKRMEEELEQSIGELDVLVKRLEENLAGMDAQINAKEETRQKLMEALRESEHEKRQAGEQLAAAKSRLEERMQQLDSYVSEKKAADAEMGELAEWIGRTKKQSDALQQEYDALYAGLAEKEQQAEQSREYADGLKERLNTLEKEQAERNHAKNLLLNNIQHLKDEAARTQEELEQIESGRQELERALGKLREQKRQAKEELDDIMVSVKNAGAFSEEQFARREALNKELDDLSRAQEEARGRKNEQIEQKYRLTAAKEKAELQLEAIQNKLFEDYEMTYANALHHKTEFAFQAATREIEEIKNRIREMGAVNPNAIEDYQRVRERYDGLMLQRDDLLKAGEDLKVVIGNLMEGMESSFRERFALIGDNFSRVFSELFGGGQAKLQLLDDGDVMECGIDIICEPPGKKLQNLTLLSGGERALSAIALLFAMLSINPSPVCLLDEIDAALDDANVIRLCDYLKKMAGTLQFIVITHRKPTMAICDTLYGIAMQEKGVSDIVSVRLS
jgi:chromosome segregation protein